MSTYTLGRFFLIFFPAANCSEEGNANIAPQTIRLNKGGGKEKIVQLKGRRSGGVSLFAIRQIMDVSCVKRSVD